MMFRSKSNSSHDDESIELQHERKQLKLSQSIDSRMKNNQFNSWLECWMPAKPWETRLIEKSNTNASSRNNVTSYRAEDNNRAKDSSNINNSKRSFMNLRPSVLLC